ncbi:transcription termination factor NusA [Rubinisphaera margarita]|uniref:transcription termination factor NusA n=1 Tax=Rubinisphaera margarita TaxID=2909586 RepID=UPI001EE8F715|nr:transcription termination factor NusA [Rubinisphaera margarita]MCG6158059.1 transcription termination factor NusA [Rubinisphaera margarita]
MNASEVLRIVDAIHRDKSIDKEIVFEGIEQAILTALRKYYGEEDELSVLIDRTSGEPTVTHNGEDLDPDILGRIAAQTAKQVMIQKIREAERDSLYDEFIEQKSQLMTGTITRLEYGVATVNIGKAEAILPRSEQIPGESHRVNERIRAVILDIKKAGSRIKIVLSRVHPDFVRRLFEIEIPEVAENVIEVRSLAREAGYRTKVAVSCYDNSIDAVGACVGVRGARIRNIVDELSGERIDIVRWNDSLQVLIPNALQPAEVEDVILCPMLGRVIVLVRDDQLSLAIGKKGQNVRLASKLVGWDIEVMTRDELDEQLERSVAAFSQVPDLSEDLAESLVSQGFFSFDDLSVIEPEHLIELSGLSAEQCDEIIAYADVESLRLEEEEKIAKAAARTARAQEKLAVPSSGGTSSEQSAPSVSTAVETSEAPTEEAPVAEATAEEASTEEPGEETAEVGTTEETEVAPESAETRIDPQASVEEEAVLGEEAEVQDVTQPGAEGGVEEDEQKPEQEA